MLSVTRFKGRAAQAARGGVGAILAGALLSACSNSGSSTAPPRTSTLVGVFADSSESGVITITIATGTLALVPPNESDVLVFRLFTPAYANAASVVSASATLAIQRGATFALSGTYDTGSHRLSLSGGGYTFTGTYSNGVLSGTFTNSAGAGGGFTTQAGSPGAVVGYCGTFTSSAGGGFWIVTVNAANNVVAGVAYEPSTRAEGLITGTASGSSLTGIINSSQGESPTWSATVSGTNLSGTWRNPTTGETGTITGAKCS